MGTATHLTQNNCVQPLSRQGSVAPTWVCIHVDLLTTVTKGHSTIKLSNLYNPTEYQLQ